MKYNNRMWNWFPKCSEDNINPCYTDIFLIGGGGVEQRARSFIWKGLFTTCHKWSIGLMLAKYHSHIIHYKSSKCSLKQLWATWVEVTLSCSNNLLLLGYMESRNGCIHGFEAVQYSCHQFICLGSSVALTHAIWTHYSIVCIALLIMGVMISMICVT